MLASLAAAAGAVGACSDDDTTTKPVGAAGEGGEAPAAGGSGAAPGTAGSSDQAGMPSGEGGVAGMPQVPSAGEECAACGATECKAELDSCSDNPDCSRWLACLSACDDEPCIDACDATNEGVARVYYGVYDCLCGQCQDECSAASSCDKQCVDDEALPESETAPATLAETGLYAGYALGEGGAGGADGAGGAPALDPAVDPMTIAPYVQLFEPKYALWADGAEKERHIYVPKCATIDNSDPDHWDFPVGTRLWKRFTVPGNSAGGTRVETRFMHRFGAGEADWTFAAYQWSVDAPDDPAAAVLVTGIGIPAVTNANGTTHDIPALDQCQNCHTRVSERVLGFSAFQLTHERLGDDVTIEKISHLGWLTEPMPEGVEVPGTPVQQAALGYLHANCGHCHNPSQMIGIGDPNNNTPAVFRLVVDQTDYADTDTVTSSVGVIVGSAMPAITGKQRIAPMDPANSAILLRMEARGVGLQMPPLATTSTKVADTEGGVADVTAWVNSIAPQ